MKKLITAQLIVLIAGTLFAWGNFIYEFINWLNNKNCAACSFGSTLQNPFITPCFGGAIFFTIALTLSIIIYKKQ